MKTALASVVVANHIYRALHKSTAPPTECVMDFVVPSAADRVRLRLAR